jgi:hypothetical protein
MLTVNHSTRFLSEYRLRSDGKALILLSTRTIDDNPTEHFLVNNEAEGIQRAVRVVVRRRTLGRTLREELAAPILAPRCDAGLSASPSTPTSRG